MGINIGRCPGQVEQVIFPNALTQCTLAGVEELKVIVAGCPDGAIFADEVALRY